MLEGEEAENQLTRGAETFLLFLFEYTCCRKRKQILRETFFCSRSLLFSLFLSSLSFPMSATNSSFSRQIRYSFFSIWSLKLKIAAVCLFLFFLPLLFFSLSRSPHLHTVLLSASQPSSFLLPAFA